MAIVLLSITPSNKRRIRLNFSNTLASGAFGLSPNSMYQIESQDGIGADPSIDASLVIPGSITTCELSLSEELVEGGRYELTVVNVPATDATNTGTATQQFSISQPDTFPNKEINRKNWDLVLYGKDLIWSGGDFVESVNGDLAVNIGVPVVHKALLKRGLSDGLPWDPNYGVHPTEYVDTVPGLMPSLRGAILTQLSKDDRVRSVKAEFVQLSESSSQFVITPTLIGNKTPTSPITLEVGN